MIERDKIDDRYKWDLSSFFKDGNEFKNAAKFVNDNMEEITKFEGKLKDAKTILECLKFDSKISQVLEKLYVYVSLIKKQDNRISSSTEMVDIVTSMLTKWSELTSFITVEISELENSFLKELSENKLFKNFDVYLKQVIRMKKHILSKKEEKLISGMGDFLGGFSEDFDFFDDADLEFPDVLDSKGRKHQLNHSVYGDNMQSPDRELRKNTFIKYHQAYGNFINFLSSNYISEVKKDCFFAKLRGYESCLDSSVYGEQVTKEVYNILIKKVKENIKTNYEYLDLKKKILGLNNFAIYDNFAPVSAGTNKKYTYDEAIELIKKAVKPIGDDYVELIQRAKDERWIDVMPNLGKDSGAFSWSAYGAMPVVLTNFTGSLESVFTLAHELGHAIHSYYSHINQPYEKAGYEIYVAEIASTVNEMLLLRYMLSASNSDKEKIMCYDHLLRMARTTIFRQTMFAEFEQFAHDHYEAGNPLSKDLLCNKYYELNEFYHGPKVKMVPEVKFEWARIPHFYNSFYVYKYATGLISSLAISKKLIEEEDEKIHYKNFLSTGCSLPPLDIIRLAKIDLEGEKTFDDAFEFLNDILKQWKSLYSGKSKR